MPTGYQIQHQHLPHFLTLQIVDWVDIFTRKIYKDQIVDALNYCVENKGLTIYGFVIMSNHIHLIAKSSEKALSDVIRDFKSYTSKQMLAFVQSGKESRGKWMLRVFSESAKRHKRNANFQVWTHENHSIELFSADFFQNKLDYIHNNPVRAGWVSLPEHYIYSSAIDYSGEIGLVKIEKAKVKWK